MWACVERWILLKFHVFFAKDLLNCKDDVNNKNVKSSYFYAYISTLRSTYVNVWMKMCISIFFPWDLLLIDVYRNFKNINLTKSKKLMKVGCQILWWCNFVQEEAPTNQKFSTCCTILYYKHACIRRLVVVVNVINIYLT